jgi:hypothetical protein
MPTILRVLYGMLSLTYPTVGALIASRRPENTVGWIFCFFGLLLIVSSFVGRRSPRLRHLMQQWHHACGGKG